MKNLKDDKKKQQKYLNKIYYAYYI